MNAEQPLHEILATMHNVMALRHMSHGTEEAYSYWIKRFVRFHDNQNPAAMHEPHVRSFLTYLIEEEDVSASTQNQAFNAILFLYRHALQVELGAIGLIPRALRTARIPVVLSRQEVQAVLHTLNSPYQLMAAILYGAGLRLRECIRLRIKDIDLENGEIIVREGKGEKDRYTILPGSLLTPVEEQIARTKHHSNENTRMLHANSDGNTSFPPPNSPSSREPPPSNATTQMNQPSNGPSEKHSVPQVS
jgi:site-specific recombinase XerD